MNLQESIRRILREETDIYRYRKVNNAFQKIVDQEIENMREICRTLDADDELIISFDACSFFDMNVNVRVTELSPYLGTPRVLIVIETDKKNIDERSFVGELQNALYKWIGKNRVEVEDIIYKS